MIDERQKGSDLMCKYFKGMKRLEKQNKALGERVLQLEKDKGKLTDENEQLKKELDSYKAFDSKYDEIEEDTKVIVKENEELKKQISVLLSCSNCTENKGGYICEKEYNNKCLAQKIEYIKELKEQIEKMKCCENCHNFKKGKCKEDNMFWARVDKLQGKTCKDWEQAE